MQLKFSIGKQKMTQSPKKASMSVAMPVILLSVVLFVLLILWLLFSKTTGCRLSFGTPWNVPLDEHVYLTYGTISDAGIDRFVGDMSLNRHDVFYDLGSGVGNVCDRVFWTTPVKKCVGIEYVKEQYMKSLELACTHGERQLLFIHGNFMHEDISDATVVFMDSIMFSHKTFEKIEDELLSKCKYLRYVVSMRALPSTTNLKFIKTEMVPASWGMSQYNLYVR